MKSEETVTKEVKLGLSVSFRCVLSRNNVGAYMDSKSGRQVRYGLMNETKLRNSKMKSSDEIGWTPVIVTQAMVGHTLSVFTAIEMKKEGYKPSGKAGLAHYNAQKAFCDAVTSHGGISGIVDSREKAVDLVQNWLNKFGA